MTTVCTLSKALNTVYGIYLDYSTQMLLKRRFKMALSVHAKGRLSRVRVR